MTSRSRLELAIGLTAVLLGLGGFHVRAGSIEAHSPSTRRIVTVPGRIVTLSVSVENRGPDFDEVAEKVVLPVGCQKVAPPDLPFRIPAGAQVIRVLAIAVPGTMPAGSASIRYTAQSRRDPSSLSSLDFELEVAPVRRLGLTVASQSDIVVAGDSYPIKLQVTNYGNAPTSVTLAHRSSLNFPVFVYPSVIELQPGETRELSGRVETPKDFHQHTTHAVTFDLSAQAKDGKVEMVSQASVADIIPRVNGSSDPFHYFPMQLRLTTVADQHHNPELQAELSGSGSLDEEGKHRLELMFRGPDVQTASLFGERDEYGFGYRGEHLDLDLGDRVYSLSALTERHTLGRGVGLAWHDRGISIGGFYMETRFRRENEKELGAYVRRDFTPTFGLQLNFLRKWGGDRDISLDGPVNLITLEAHYHYRKLLDLTLEGGLSVGSHGRAEGAHRVEARGELPGGLDYSIEHVHSGARFHGSYSNDETTYATLTKSFTPRFRARVSMTRYSGNVSESDIRSTVVNREDSWRAGVDYDVDKKTTVSAEWQHISREDILQPAAYDFTADGVRLGVSHDFGKLKMISFVELGSLDNAIDGKSGSYQRYTASAFWRPTAQQTYSAFASYGPSAYTGSLDDELSFGASGTWRLKDRVEANLSYAHNQYDNRSGNEQDQLMGSLRYQFKNKSYVSVIGRYTHATTQLPGAEATDEAAVMVSYTVPMEVPMSRRRSIGAIEGRVIDSSAGRATGVPRVVLQIGEKFAVSDEAGHFEFPGLPPGAVELKVVPDSLGPRLALLTPMPLKLRVLPAETTRAEVQVGAASSLSVCVVQYDFLDGRAVNAGNDLKRVGGIGGVAVELSNGKDLWRAQTDRLGACSFERLAGGNWTLRAASSDLPAYHQLESPQQVVPLTPGKAGEIVLRVLPQKRTLRLLDQGTIR